VDDAAAALGWASVADIALGPVEDYLAGKMASGQWSGTTHDSAASALRSLGRFLHRRRHLDANPFLYLERSNDTGEPGSRALRTDEARRLIAAALDRWRGDRRQKANAPLFYAVLLLTGLRCDEAAHCRWKDLVLDSDTPFLATDPAWAKNGRRQVVPLNTEIAGLLRAARATTPSRPTDRVFASHPNRHTWGRDRLAAGIADRDERGRSATMHSCRKWLASTLDELGVPQGVRRAITRHSGGIDDRYVDHPAEAQVLAVSRLPLLWPHEPTGGAENIFVPIVEPTADLAEDIGVTRPTPHFPDDPSARRGGSARCVTNTCATTRRAEGPSMEHGNAHSRPLAGARPAVSVPDEADPLHIPIASPADGSLPSAGDFPAPGCSGCDSSRATEGAEISAACVPGGSGGGAEGAERSAHAPSLDESDRAELRREITAAHRRYLELMARLSRDD
jgi:integrase